MERYGGASVRALATPVTVSLDISGNVTRLLVLGIIENPSLMTTVVQGVVNGW